MFARTLYFLGDPFEPLARARCGQACAAVRLVCLTAAENRHETAAWCETLQSAIDVIETVLVIVLCCAGFHGARRERRIHEDDGRLDRAIEQRVDDLAIVRGRLAEAC